MKSPLHRESASPFPGWLLIVGIGIALLIGIVALLAVFSAGWSPKSTVLVIPLQGTISSDSDSTYSQQLSTQEIVDSLKEADEDPSVAAVLLDIESPGGSIVATKQIVAQIRETKKPVVSRIGDLGASGAYYAAAASDFVIADSDSLTGSIGVISMFLNLEGLLEKIGVKAKIVKEGKFKAIGSPFQEMTPEEEKLLQVLLHDAFLNFKKDIRDFRGEKLDSGQFDEITDGRILSGSQALKAGLIDGLGTREQAIQKAAEMGGITGKPAIESVSKSLPSLFDLFLRAGLSFGKGMQNSFSPLSSEPVIQAR